MDIAFSFQTAVALQNRRRLKVFIAEMFRREKVQAASLSIVFCDAPYMVDLNRRSLRHAYLTDIITFNYSEKNLPVEGELFISPEMVRDNAHYFATSFLVELHRVIFHGVLHLCGYNDKSKAQAAEIRKMEDHYLNAYFPGRPGGSTWNEKNGNKR